MSNEIKPQKKDGKEIKVTKRNTNKETLGINKMETDKEFQTIEK
jgi:hypothetical protein